MNDCILESTGSLSGTKSDIYEELRIVQQWPEQDINCEKMFIPHVRQDDYIFPHEDLDGKYTGLGWAVASEIDYLMRLEGCYWYRELKDGDKSPYPVVPCKKKVVPSKLSDAFSRNGWFELVSDCRIGSVLYVTLIREVGVEVQESIGPFEVTLNYIATIEPRFSPALYGGAGQQKTNAMVEWVQSEL
jgi:hypothetical protein